MRSKVQTLVIMLIVTATSSVARADSWGPWTRIWNRPGSSDEYIEIRYREDGKGTYWDTWNWEFYNHCHQFAHITFSWLQSDSKDHHATASAGPETIWNEPYGWNNSGGSLFPEVKIVKVTFDGPVKHSGPGNVITFP